MALASSCTGIICNPPNRSPCTHFLPHRTLLNPSPPSSRASNLTVSATPKRFSRTGKFDSKNRRNSPVTTTKEEEKLEEEAETVSRTPPAIDDGFVVPELPGDKPDIWEGPQMDAFGFFVQYMWAFGIVFALVACGIAVSTYNEGATDFKETPVYKEATESRELLEEPDASKPDVFESNPTEQAPSLE